MSAWRSKSRFGNAPDSNTTSIVKLHKLRSPCRYEKMTGLQKPGWLAVDVGRIGPRQAEPRITGEILTPPPSQKPADHAPMPVSNPHYVLYSEAGAMANAASCWRFVLQSVDGGNSLVASDEEPGTSGNRLELLAVVRALEALDQPSRVTLLTRSRYVSRGIRQGLSQWRERKWRWERFGKLVPIRDQDLWQRVDRALEFHHVQCCASPFEGEVDQWPDELDASPAESRTARPAPATTPKFEHTPDLSRRERVGSRIDSKPLQPLVRGPVSRTFHRLRQGVLSPLAAIWRPAFTPAA
jgi:ribonuclease HI